MQEMVEFLGCLLAWKAVAARQSGVGKRHVPVRARSPGACGSPDKAALFGSDHEAGECGLLRPEALRQFSHSSGAEGQRAE